MPSCLTSFIFYYRQGIPLQKLTNDKGDCTSACLPVTKENTLYTSNGSCVCIYDVRNFQTSIETLQYNEEEINQIVLDESEKHLAACDDSGEIKIISLSDKKVFKTLRRKHTNICSTVCFRPRKPWEVFSGGMDCNLIHWDFSRPRCVNQFNMQELSDAPSELGAYMVNPPFVHHLSTSKDGKYLACALENGMVSLFDTSKKHASELVSLHAHSQGASQVYFVSDTKMITGGNDATVALWDVSKIYEEASEPHSPPQRNGHSTPIHDRNWDVTEACKISEVQHDSKINWLKPVCVNNENYVIIADQTLDLTLLPFAY